MRPGPRQPARWLRGRRAPAPGLWALAPGVTQGCRASTLATLFLFLKPSRRFSPRGKSPQLRISPNDPNTAEGGRRAPTRYCVTRAENICVILAPPCKGRRPSPGEGEGKEKRARKEKEGGGEKKKGKKRKKKAKEKSRGRPAAFPCAGRPCAAACPGKPRRRRACPQRIVATRLLYRLQGPFARLSRLQRIRSRPSPTLAIRGGAPRGTLRPPGALLRPVGCWAAARSRGLAAPAWDAREVPPLPGTGSGLEAFSRYPADGSFAAPLCRTAAETNYPN